MEEVIYPDSPKLSLNSSEWIKWKSWATYFHPTICLTVFFVALLSSHIAFLNPRPTYEVVKVPSYPFLWQYNLDSGTELFSAAYFPERFRTDPTRVTRPAFPLVIHLISLPIEGAQKLITGKGSRLVATAAAYFLFKCFLHILIGSLLVVLLSGYIDSAPAILAAVLLLTHNINVTYLSTFHTTDMQYLSPIIMVYLFEKLSKKYSFARCFIFSLIVGMLVLIKQNYAVYMAIIAFGIYKKKYKDVALSLSAVVIPYIVWRLYLSYLKIPYTIVEETQYKMGFVFLKELVVKNPLETAQLVLYSIRDFALSSVLFYSVLLIPLPFFFYQQKKNKNLILFASFTIFFTCLQHFFARKEVVAVMASDFSFLVFSVAAYYFYLVVPRFYRSRVVTSCLALWVFCHIIAIVNFPWVSPAEQKEYKIKSKYTEEMNLKGAD